MYIKKQKELYYTNTILNFWDSPFSPSVSMLCHLLKNTGTSQKNQIVGNFDDLRFIKKQIFLKFLNQSSVISPIYLNGRLLVASSSLSVLDIPTLLKMNNIDFSLIGSNWDTFYFSDSAFEIISHYSKMFRVNTIMELDQKMKELFIYQFMTLLIPTNVNIIFLSYLNKVHLVSSQTILVTPTSD
jgi:hypothetical protein